MKKSKLTFKVLLILAAFAGSVNFAFAWNNCGSGPWVSFSFADGYTVYQDGWGSQDYQSQTLCVNSASNWSSSGSFTGGGVKCYPHTQKDVNLPINSDSWCTANFNCSAPNNGTWYNFMFDCWTTNMQDELIISEMWNGDAIWGDLVASNVTIGGTSFREVRKANNGANNVLIFTPYNKRSSGSENLMAIFQWSKDRGLLVNSSSLFQVSWGVEITYTNGWQEFTCNSFSLSFGQNSGGTSGNVSIQNRATGLYIDGMGRTSNGSNAGQWSNSSSSNQKWTMETSGSNVKFKNVATGLYLDGMYWSSNGSDLAQWSSSGSDAQQWTITSLKSAPATVLSVNSANEGSSDILLYPNPFASEINIRIADPEQVNRIEVIDMLGKQVEVIEHADVKTEQVIGSSLNAGVYVVQIYSADSTRSFKIIKK